MTTPRPIVANPDAFRKEGRSHRFCAICDKPGRFLAHHVFYEQHLTLEGLRGNALFDTRNALGVHALCHHGHHHAHRAGQKIKASRLLDCNIEYGFEVMGAKAYDYLVRRYDGAADDPRIKLKLEEYS